MKKKSARAAHTADIIVEITPVFNERIDSWYIANGSVALFSYKDGNAYEVEVRPASLAQHKDIFDPYLSKNKKQDSMDIQEDVEASGSSWYKKAKSNKKTPLNFTERQQVKNRFGSNLECSFFKDDEGYYCATHRSRSDSYKTINKIPKSVVKRIGSTG